MSSVTSYFTEELEETMLGIVTCFFNPCGYKRNVENYFRFRDALGHDLVTVELSFNGEFVIPDAIQLQGDSKNIMWQKERLLNIGIESLPDQYDKVAWLDADLLFLNPNWLAEAEEKLEEVPLVQLFENIQHLNSQGHITKTQTSWMKGLETDNLRRGKSAPGGAWAARRDILSGGLLDIDVTGGNDTAAVDCWLGDWNSWMFRQYSPKWKAGVLEWGKQQFEQIKGQLGYLSGDIVHLYHGSDKNRNYGKRASYLIDHDFDPAKDITKDKNGL